MQEITSDFPDSDRLRAKNRPTCLLRFNDSLSKLDPADLLDLQAFDKNVGRLTAPTTVCSVADFAGYLSKGGLDNTVVIYFNKDQTQTTTAQKYLIHLTAHPILKVEDE